MPTIVSEIGLNSGSGFEKWKRSLSKILKTCKQQEKLLKRTLNEKENVIQDHEITLDKLRQTRDLLAMEKGNNIKKSNSKIIRENGTKIRDLQSKNKSLKEELNLLRVDYDYIKARNKEITRKTKSYKSSKLLKASQEKILEYELKILDDKLKLEKLLAKLRTLENEYPKPVVHPDSKSLPTTPLLKHNRKKKGRQKLKQILSCKKAPKTERNRKRKSYRNWATQVNNLSSENERLRKEIGIFRKSLPINDASAKNTVIREELKLIRNDNECLQRENIQLKKEVDEITDSYTSPHRCRILKPRRILESNLSTSLKVKTKQLDSLSQENIELRKKNEHLEEMVKNIKDELSKNNVNQSYIDSINGQMLDIETKMAEENQSLHVQLTKKQSQLDKLESHNKTVDEEIAAVEQEVEYLRSLAILKGPPPKEKLSKKIDNVKQQLEKENSEQIHELEEKLSKKLENEIIKVEIQKAKEFSEKIQEMKDRETQKEREYFEKLESQETIKQEQISEIKKIKQEQISELKVDKEKIKSELENSINEREEIKCKMSEIQSEYKTMMKQMEKKLLSFQDKIQEMNIAARASRGVWMKKHFFKSKTFGAKFGARIIMIKNQYEFHICGGHKEKDICYDLRQGFMVIDGCQYFNDVKSIERSKQSRCFSIKLNDISNGKHGRIDLESSCESDRQEWINYLEHLKNTIC